MIEIVYLNAETRTGLLAAIETAGRQIPPVWPLSATVAVNPFLGQSEDSLAVVAARLGRVAGASVAMPRPWYRARIYAGDIMDADLEAALLSSPHTARPAGLAALKTAIAQDPTAPRATRTVADLAAAAGGTDWPGVIADRIGAWAGGHFDQGQALWAAPRSGGVWGAWRTWATHDLTPEILGLKGFAGQVANAPTHAVEAIEQSLAVLGVEDAALGTYLHQLLLSLGGWAQYARGELWRAELKGETDDGLRDFLAIRLFWEAALYRQYSDAVADQFTAVKARHSAPIAPGPDQIVDEILQEAVERAEQRRIGDRLAAPAAEIAETRPALQAAFCIDVRSETFRRALESVDPGIRTLGFAGFFGIAVEHRGFASDAPEHRLPVLLNAAVTSKSGTDDAQEEQTARFAARARRAWGRFKLAAVSSFAFVEAAGPIYLGRLVRDALGLRKPAAPGGPAPRFAPSLDLPSRIEAAETVLRAMSLTGGFARVVLLAGHGAGVSNNPHASALQCGACGGHSGEINARLLAALLNDPEVRSGLAERGIPVPEDTLFVAALHDTTTDAVEIYSRDADSPDHGTDLAQIQGWLAQAGQIARADRMPRLPGARTPADLLARASDWAEVRPEWGLAGCQAFIAAPRSRTTGNRLEGRAFLHDYDWRQDQERDFAVLELILTAPVVVASWISLQYYGSTVAPQTFGSGDKLLHNVVGGVGVFEGNGGVLRAGLPWQSVHDGTDYAHDPLRLSVYVEAPRDAMNDILQRHPGVRALFDNRWLHLLALDDAGQPAARYVGGLCWEETAPPESAAA